MAQVHTFATDNDLYSDTRIPFQYRGNSRPNQARAFELSALKTWLESNMAIPGAPTVVFIVSGANTAAIPAGKLLEKIVVIGSGNFILGTSSGGSDLVDAGTATAEGQTFVLERHFETAGTIHFSGFTGTLKTKIYTR